MIVLLRRLGCCLSNAALLPGLAGSSAFAEAFRASPQITRLLPESW